MDRSQRRRATLGIGVVVAMSSLLVVPAVASGAAEPPFDTEVNFSCDLFGMGPEGPVAIQKQISVSGTGDVRTVGVLITWPSQAGEAEEVVDCIAIGDDAAGVVASISDVFVTASELAVTFTVGLQGSGADIIIADGDRICDMAVVYFTASAGVSDVFCSDPIMFSTTATTPGGTVTPGPSTTAPATSAVPTTSPASTTSPTSTPSSLPATGGSPHAGVLVGGILALLAGVLTQVLARRST